MHDWNYVVYHPITLTISADARLSPIDPANDQVWELNLGSSEPPAVSLQTTFGLRARACRIFPRFINDGQTINNPKEFYRPITIHRYYPNYLSLSFKPFQYINAVLEYWVPDAESIACRAKIVNLSREKRQIQMEWAELLIPGEEGHRMSATEIGLVTILAGQTGSLSPVLFLAGGAHAGKSPYPSLDLTYTIQPHQEQEILWAHAALAETDAAYEHAKMLTGKNWDTEIARVTRENSQRVEIITGEPEWDTAFYLSQTIANQLLKNSGVVELITSYQTTRKPDQGYSLVNDSANHNIQQKPSSSLCLQYLMNFLLPESPGIFKVLLEDLISGHDSQSDEGEIPPLHGEQNQLLATPILSHLTWEYFRYTGSSEFLRDSFPKLLAIFLSWFTEAHDRDNDSIPEWNQPAQTGFEENPLFSFADESSLGVDITSVESPDLISYLYNDCQALISIAHKIDHQESISRLENIAAALKAGASQAWDDAEACYLYRDRDSHVSIRMQALGDRKGSGVIDIHREFMQPIRPLIHITTRQEGTRPVQIYIQGITASGSHRVDHLPSGQVHWHLNTGYVTSKYTYVKVEQVEITGLSIGDEVIVLASGTTGLDITQLLPLWAALPSEEQAKVLINLTIMNKKRFLCPFGLRTYVELQDTEIRDELASVRPEWISFIISGMLRYGERKKAAELFSRLIKAVSKSITQDMTLHQYYHESTGKPLGAVNSLFSLIPVGLFLETLGLKIHNPTEIEIMAGNPFPWPVTIKYRGLTVVHQEKKTLVIFSDGQNITIDNHAPALVTQRFNEPVET